MATNNQRSLAKVKKILDPSNLTNIAYPVFVGNTPIKTGNARRNTVKGNNEIDALYPYAQRLDNGYSKQSPQGMSKPTMAYIRAYIKRQLGI